MVVDREEHGIERWLRPPPADDPETERIGGAIHTLSLAFSVTTCLWVVFAALALGDLTPSLPPVGISLAVLASSYALVHRGRVRLAARIFTGGLWLAVTWATAISGGGISPVFSGYLVVILLAGLLDGVRGASVVTLLSTGAGFVLTALAGAGRLPLQVTYSPWAAIGLELTFFIAAASLLFETLREGRAMVDRAEQSEERTRALIDQASDGIIVFDRKGRILEANDKTALITGYSQSELRALDVSAFLEGGALADAQQILSTLRPGVSVTRERVVRLRDGSSLQIENSITALRDGRIQSIVRDVTERKRAEQMNAQLRRAMDAADEGILLFDSTPRVIYANPAFHRLNGAPEPPTPGQRPDEVSSTPAALQLIAQAREDLAAGRSFAGRYDLPLPNGRRSVRSLTVGPVREGAETIGYVAVLRDFTRETELEESLELTRKVETVGKLAGGLAHDFNNLLTVILGSAGALKTKAPSQEVDEIVDAGQRAAAITTQLLAFNRHQAMNARRIDLNQVIGEASTMLRRLVRESVSMRLDLSTEALFIDTDPSRVHQILVNLAANARDAMPDGGRIDLVTRSIPETGAGRPEIPGLPKGELAELTFRDDGEGMEPDVLARLFEPFFTTKEPGRGTGLGLASVREIVKESGGAIDVASERGIGTTVRVFWPQSEGPVRSESEPDGARRLASRGQLDVLVAEDEPMLVRLIERGLRGRGHRVRTAPDGETALRLGLEDRPDLLVSDVILPGLGGGTLVEKLRETYPDLPVLLTSGYAPDDVLGGLPDDDRTAFLPKPFDLDQLLDSVDELAEDAS